MSLGAVGLFSPIILRMVLNRSGEGISLTTFWLQLLGFSSVFVYNYTKNFPFSAYGENLSLAAQSLAVLVTAAHYQQRAGAGFVLALAAYFGWMACALGGAFSPAALSAMQVAGTAILTGAIVPQIVLNHKRKDAGEWSVITALLSTSGNAVRVFTTLQLTGDPLMLTGYVLGFAVNAVLLFQIVHYRRCGAALRPAGRRA